LAGIAGLEGLLLAEAAIVVGFDVGAADVGVEPNEEIGVIAADGVVGFGDGVLAAEPRDGGWAFAANPVVPCLSCVGVDGFEVCVVGLVVAVVVGCLTGLIFEGVEEGCCFTGVEVGVGGFVKVEVGCCLTWDGAGEEGVEEGCCLTGEGEGVVKVEVGCCFTGVEVGCCLTVDGVGVDDVGGVCLTGLGAGAGDEEGCCLAGETVGENVEVGCCFTGVEVGVGGFVKVEVGCCLT
jgi:hypothetical protein